MIKTFFLILGMINLIILGKYVCDAPAWKWTEGANLNSEQVVNSWDDDVDGRVVPCLCPQVVLEV